jgi:anti-sigma regulatory factor (Ser/Thr protein kinase)
VIDEASVSLVRERVREEGSRAGLDEVATGSLVSAASELAHNQLAHAKHGLVLVRPVERAGARGVEVIAADRGPGIADVRGALEGRGPHEGSLGVGLSAVCELADEVDLDVRLGEGTCVCARKFPPGTSPRRRRRVGVYGRAYPGERASGDDAVCVRTPDGLLVALADGLGHGDPARDASARAVRTVAAHAGEALDQILAATHGALLRTRGAVMTVARVHDADVALAGVGNVAAHGVGFGSTWRFGGTSSVLGDPRGYSRAASENRQLGAHSALVLCSDGVRTHIDLPGDPGLVREHPAVVAQHVVEHFGRNDDDALVVVVS